MAMIAPKFLDSVVAIGTISNDKKNWIGTGFIFGRYQYKDEKNENHYYGYLVTNKHVINSVNNLVIRFNSQENNLSKDYEIDLLDETGDLIWVGHPDSEVDVAVIWLNIPIVHNEGMKCTFFAEDEDVLLCSDLKNDQVTEGDSIFVLGFPMGLIRDDRQHVFTRSGIISRIQDLYESKCKDYVIDSFVFPGNSGGPVLLKPELASIRGTKAHDRSVLIGIVKSYIPYVDRAVSQQTGRPRILFEENTGLTMVETVDSIVETIIEYERIKNK